MRPILRAYSFFAILLILGAFAIAQPNPDGELKELAGFKYVERVENASVDDKNLPLVIGLHWSGATPNSFAADISGFEKPVRMLLVQGAYPHPDGGYSFYVQSPVSYYDMAADEKMSILLQEAEKLSKFIKAAANLYSPKKKPVIIGASQGGDLSYVTAIRYGSLISGAFPLLATFDERILRNNATRKRQAPIFAFHGTDDPIVPIATVEHHIKALTASGYNARLRTYSGIKHDIPKSMKSDYLREVGKLLF